MITKWMWQVAPLPFGNFCNMGIPLAPMLVSFPLASPLCPALAPSGHKAWVGHCGPK